MTRVWLAIWLGAFIGVCAAKHDGTLLFLGLLAVGYAREWGEFYERDRVRRALDEVRESKEVGDAR